MERGLKIKTRREACESVSKVIQKAFGVLKEKRKKAIDSSIEILREGDEDARWMAAGVLGEICSDETVDPLMAAFRIEKSADVRVAILQALEAHICDDAVRIFFADSRKSDESDVVRKEAGKAMRNNPGARKRIIEKWDFLELLLRDRFSKPGPECEKYKPSMFSYALQNSGKKEEGLSVKEMVDIKRHLSKCPHCFYLHLEYEDEIKKGVSAKEKKMIKDFLERKRSGK